MTESRNVLQYLVIRMNGPAEAVGVTCSVSENFEPHAKKQRLDNDCEQKVDFQTSLPSKSLQGN